MAHSARPSVSVSPSARPIHATTQADSQPISFVRFGPFWDVELDNHVTLAYIRADEHHTLEHYTGLVREEGFDQIFRRTRRPFSANPDVQRDKHE